MKIHTYRCRFYPKKEFEKVLFENINAASFVYNKCLEQSIYHYKLSKQYNIGKGPYINRKYFNTILKLLKNDYPFLKEADASCLQQSYERLIKAYERFFKIKGGYPKFKSIKNPNKSFTLKNTTFKTKKGDKKSTIRIENGKLRLNKLGYITLKDNRKITGNIKQVTIKYENNRWYAHIIHETENIQKYPKTGKKIGIDVGIINFMTLSNGQVIKKPPLDKIDAKIIKYQQKMSQQKKYGSNWKKTRKKLYKAINKKKDIINDYRHKVSTNIVKEYDFIAMETLNIQGLMKNKHNSHNIQESGWYTIKSMIKYKSDWYGKKFVTIDQWFPSSKKCSSCEYIFDNLKSNTRKWCCPKCKTIHDRDYNAAKNILNEALRTEGTPGICLVDLLHVTEYYIIKSINVA